MAYNKNKVLQDNTEAIRVVLRLEKERREATEQEKAILRGYRGFGGLKCILNRCDSPEDIQYWNKSEQPLFEQTACLKQMIVRDAIDTNSAKRYWESIKASVLTSFYTDERIVSAISDAVSDNGIAVRRCLDPSAGMGVFSEVFSRKGASVDAMEKDLLTSRILMALHPLGKDRILVDRQPFEAIDLRDERYDLITSNIPFGDFMVYDRDYSKGKDAVKKESTRAIHNYFFVKALDCTKEGGMVAFITSQGVLDSPSNTPIRTYLMQNSRLVSALRLPSGMFSDNAGTDVGSDLIVLQKQSGKSVETQQERLFIESVTVKTDSGESFSHNALFDGDWQEVRQRIVATDRELGTNPYGKPAWVYKHDEGMDSIAYDLKEKLSADLVRNFDHKLYTTGIPQTMEERKAQAERATETEHFSNRHEHVATTTEESEEDNFEQLYSEAHDLIPDSLRLQLPKMYATEKERLGDRTAYVRYFHPLGAYTAYLLEYDPKENLGFGAVTMGYGWELGYMSLQEMREVSVRGVGIERDLSFTPRKLHQIQELEELVDGDFTQEQELGGGLPDGGPDEGPDEGGLLMAAGEAPDDTGADNDADDDFSETNLDDTTQEDTSEDIV